MNTIMIELNKLYRSYCKLSQKKIFFKGIRNLIISNEIRKEIEDIVFDNDIFELSEMILSLIISARDYITDDRLSIKSMSIFTIETSIGNATYNNRDRSLQLIGPHNIFTVSNKLKIPFAARDDYNKHISDLRFIYRDIINCAECALVQSEIDPFDNKYKLYNKVRRLIYNEREELY